jgi:hypothetical protein
MLDALAQSGAWLAAESPDAVVALSARWLSDGPFLVDIGKRHRTLTDYSGFGVEVRYDCAGLPALARALVDEGTRLDIRVGALSAASIRASPCRCTFLLRESRARRSSVTRAALPSQSAGCGAPCSRACSRRGGAHRVRGSRSSVADNTPGPEA